MLAQSENILLVTLGQAENRAVVSGADRGESVIGVESDDNNGMTGDARGGAIPLSATADRDDSHPETAALAH